MRSLKGDWLKITKCEACEQTADYQYNAHYYDYDDSESYGSYESSYVSEDEAYSDFDTGATWDSNSDPYSNDEPNYNQYEYGSKLSAPKRSRARNRRAALEKSSTRACDLKELKHDLSKYNPYTVKYRGQDPVVTPTNLPTTSISTTTTSTTTTRTTTTRTTTTSKTKKESTTKKKTSPIPVLPTSEVPTEQPTINIGWELTTTVQSQSTAEPTVAAIGSTAIIGIIAAIAIAILGFVSYSFYNRKKPTKETKSKIDLTEETKQESYHFLST